MFRSLGLFIGLGAIAVSGIYATMPALTGFALAASLREQWWSLVLAALGAILAIYCVRRYRLAARLELERVRTRIATDLHDDIGASLSQIALLSEFLSRRANGDPKVTGPLQQIGGVSRQLVDSMSDIVWSIDPSSDTLGDMIGRMRAFANDVFPARNIVFHFRAPSPGGEVKLAADVRRQVLLIFKESINNIVRHAECGEAAADLAVEREWLALRLTDDGRGFDCRQTGLGHGLNSMRNRARSLGGEFQVASSPRGTTVRLRIPIGGWSLPCWKRRQKWAASLRNRVASLMESMWKRQPSA